MSEKFGERRIFQSPEPGEESGGSGAEQPKQPEQSGSAEKELVELPDTLTLDSFWQSVIKGKFTLLSDEEAGKIVDKVYFSSHPLVPINGKEEEELRHNLVEHVQSHNVVNRKKLAEDNIVFVREEDKAYYNRPASLKEGKYLLIDADYIKENDDIARWVQQNDLAPTTVREKIEALSDPDIFAHSRFYCEGNVIGGRTLPGYGQRSLESYHLPKTFERIVAETRASVSHDKLVIMDVGGGIGKALHQMKEINPNIETINLTITEELAMYPSDRLILCPAERMPADLERKVDLVVSSVAFRYFTYPDLAMKNIVKCLSDGGRAYLHIGTESSMLEDEELQQRVLEMVEHLEELENKELIDLKIDRSELSRVKLANPGGRKGRYIFDGYTIIKKNKSSVADTA